ncbi:uncharacterized protein B0I36DRAFT_11412 [Microdochium trichocladiopsis]|uniref:Uncharacterized protein n=1 Tax=Microdochium trichocladiopsis TaxID=1682393 RepID=A0A9P8YHJ2_9PEZI|nr:uncharacterized protein B0I36DRAFT_11412 [Microdochium trichocladiopsis]KAH7040504.1 hypothetical protein B0I36DRAFT_11412 [Microdochium trichocladiopsis]
MRHETSNVYRPHSRQHEMTGACLFRTGTFGQRRSARNPLVLFRSSERSGTRTIWPEGPAKVAIDDLGYCRELCMALPGDEVKCGFCASKATLPTSAHHHVLRGPCRTWGGEAALSHHQRDGSWAESHTIPYHTIPHHADSPSKNYPGKGCGTPMVTSRGFPQLVGDVEISVRFVIHLFPVFVYIYIYVRFTGPARHAWVTTSFPLFFFFVFSP